MENNEVQLPLEEQLKQLKKEQEEAKKICDQKIEMGMLYHDSESVLVLAQEILNRKLKIKELEEQISREHSDRNDKVNELVEYKPKMNLFQWIKSKFDKIRDNMRISRENKMKAKFKDEDRYQRIVDDSKNKTHQRTGKTGREQFGNKIKVSDAQTNDIEDGEITIAEAEKIVANPYAKGSVPREDLKNLFTHPDINNDGR